MFLLLKTYPVPEIVPLPKSVLLGPSMPSRIPYPPNDALFSENQKISQTHCRIYYKIKLP